MGQTADTVAAVVMRWGAIGYGVAPKKIVKSMREGDGESQRCRPIKAVRTCKWYAEITVLRTKIATFTWLVYK